MSTIPTHHLAAIQDEVLNVVVRSIPTPTLHKSTDVIVKVSIATLCGSDLHIYRGHQAGPYGYVMGHEFVGHVVQIGEDVKNFKISDRVVSPFTTSCGECFYCQKGWTCRCVQSQLFGCGTLEGSQAEYVRVPLADSTLFHAPEDLSDENLVLLADILPTGIFAVKSALSIMNEEEKKDAVCVILGCGPVGLCGIVSASQHFKTVYAIDSVPERLEQARQYGAIPLNLNEDPVAAIQAATGGRGADAVLEIVGSAAAFTLGIDLARKGGVVVSCGVHTSTFPLNGANLYNKNLRFQFGRCPARALFQDAVDLIRKVNQDKPELFANFIQAKVSLNKAPEYYKLFNEMKIGKVAFVGTD